MTKPNKCNIKQMKKKNIKVSILLKDGASIPTRAHNGERRDLCYDMKSISAQVVGVRSETDENGDNILIEDIVPIENIANYSWIRINYIQYDTGVALQASDEKYGFKCYPNSRISKSDLILANSVGIIDPGYTGFIAFRYRLVRENMIDPRFFPRVGDAIGQLEIYERAPDIDFNVVEELSQTDRGDGGWGSSAKA